MSLNRREFLLQSIVAGTAVTLSAIPSSANLARPPADACVLIYLPGGASQRDLWDVKEFTPYRKGMRAIDLLSTCRSISTSAPAIRIGEGLENLAGVMHHATVVRSLTARHDSQLTHLAAQRMLLTGSDDDLSAPIGATIASQLGRRDSNVEPYIYIGRDPKPLTDEHRHIHETISAGAVGPLLIPATRTACFADNLLLAGRQLDSGARFIQVELAYTPFQGFDTHEFGHARTMQMKEQIDRPIAQFIQRLDDTRQLDRTLVIVMTEFGRTISTDYSAEIRQESQYGFHSHFAACNALLLFGGPMRRGFAYGRSAERHPMIPVENPVTIHDIHATIYRAMGIAASTGRGKPVAALFA
jgi:hypothetical protein